MPTSLSNFFWIFLYPLAVLWTFITSTRRKILGSKGYKAHVPVLCVGNLHSGGSSKTPVVIEIARTLEWLKPVVLSRGYKRRCSSRVLRVDLSSDKGASWFGDEPWLIANETKVPVWVGANRGLVALEIEKNQEGGLLILDDGFQNFSLKKDISLVCISTDNQVFDSNTLPLGLLRESFFGLKSADAILLVGGDDTTSHFLWRRYLESEWERLPVFEVKKTYFADPSIQSGKWVAFCGIAGPERFSNTLSTLQCDFELVSYNDHHAYSEKDIRLLIGTREKLGAAGFVTTQKDYYKAVEVFKKFNENLEFVKMGVTIEASFWPFIKGRLGLA